MNDNMFSDIPSLDDDAGLQALIEQQTMQELGITVDSTQQNAAPTAGQPQINPNTGMPIQTQPAGFGQIQTQNPQNLQNPQNQQPNVFTEDQVKAILQRYAQQQQQPPTAQNPGNTRQAQANQSRMQYTPQQQLAIQEAIRRGIPLDTIARTLQNPAQNSPQNNVVMQRMAQLEQQLDQMRVAEEAQRFEADIKSFGGRLGLSEKDLVTFGNKALEQGINLLYVKDYESVFRGLFPDQYALRMRRAQTPEAPQIYGGANVGTSQADTNKLEDAYVESFLKGTMPNYNYPKR